METKNKLIMGFGQKVNFSRLILTKIQFFLAKDFQLRNDSKKLDQNFELFNEFLRSDLPHE